MRYTRRITLGLAVLAAALAPAVVHADARAWFQGSIGGSTYSMGDVNDDIGTINTELSGSGFSMDELTNGWNFGGAVGLDLGRGFSFGVAYDRLSGRREVSFPAATLTYDLPGNLYRVFGRYTFRRAAKTQGFLEASVGGVSPAGGISYSVSGVGAFAGDFGGSGLALEGGGGVLWWFAPRLGLTGEAGYRHAAVNKTAVGSVPIQDVHGGDYTIDYSGLFLRAGLTLMGSP